MTVPVEATPLPRLAALFRHYADVDFPAAGAPLYAEIAAGIAADDELLALASHTRPGQPGPNLLFAAVHYLLLSGVEHPLAAYYPDLSPDQRPPAPPYPPFRDFCLQHRDAIAALVPSRLVQTNVIERCCALAPAFAEVYRRGGQRPLALVEIGCSAALNLLFDRYHYDYGGGLTWGDPASPVRLASELRGAIAPPPFPDQIPVASRTGIDLAPVDLADDDAVLWQRALMWPERIERQQRLAAAIPIVRDAAPSLIAADARDALPAALTAAPAGAALCVFATYVLYQFARDARQELLGIMRAHSHDRDVFFLSMDSEDRATGDGLLRLTHYARGESEQALLARCHPHARWIAWSAP